MAQRQVATCQDRLAKGPIVQFDENRFFNVAAGSDERAGGTLLFFNLGEPLKLAGATAEFPPQQQSIEAAHAEAEAWIDVQQPNSWDLPIWIACGGLDSLQIANSNLGRKTTIASDGRGRPRDKTLFPGPLGGARSTQEIYYQLLNCGLHVVPTAGSGSGAAANPLGYNRVYVHVDGEMTYEKWWESLRAGQVTVTNGPLIRPRVEGELPGHVFRRRRAKRSSLKSG